MINQSLKTKKKKNWKRKIKFKKAHNHKIKLRRQFLQLIIKIKNYN